MRRSSLFLLPVLLSRSRWRSNCPKQVQFNCRRSPSCGSHCCSWPDSCKALSLSWHQYRARQSAVFLFVFAKQKIYEMTYWTWPAWSSSWRRRRQASQPRATRSLVSAARSPGHNLHRLFIVVQMFHPALATQQQRQEQLRNCSAPSRLDIKRHLEGGTKRE